MSNVIPIMAAALVSNNVVGSDGKPASQNAGLVKIAGSTPQSMAILGSTTPAASGVGSTMGTSPMPVLGKYRGELPSQADTIRKTLLGQ